MIKLRIMNTIETIRAEIERLKGQLIRGACAAQIEMETNCKDEAYNEILSFLGTIQEQPVCEDVEEAAERYEHNRVYQDELYKYANYLDSLEEGETPRMEEPSPETKYFLNADIIESFKAGAKWQKDKLMGGVAEGTYSTGHFSSPCIYVPQQDLKTETPVRVIIVKED